jgi:hypothetical protein
MDLDGPYSPKRILTVSNSLKISGIRRFRPNFHAGNTGSNPVGDASLYQERAYLHILVSPFFVRQGHFLLSMSKELHFGRGAKGEII